MKPLIASFVFILAIGLSYKAIANEPELCSTEKTTHCAPSDKNQTHEQTGHEKAASSSDHSAAHGSGHGDLSAKMNALFPEKQKNSTASLRPEVTKLISPKFLSANSEGTAKLQWKEAKQATSYHVQVATDPNFKWLIANDTAVTGTTFNVANLESGKRYFWRVASVKAENESTFTKSLFVSSAFDVK